MHQAGGGAPQAPAVRSAPQPVAVRLPEKAEARQGGNDHMDNVQCARTMCGRIGERRDDLQLRNRSCRMGM
jgi:hypothetical protein